MDFTTLLVIPIIILCLLTGYILKHIVPDDAFENRWIPVVVTIEGIIVGLLLCLFGGGAISAESILNAIITGGVSGASSTGFQSIFAAFVNKAGSLMVNITEDDCITENTEEDSD